MKIAILGSRGIPNRYGGYEAFAEEFSVKLVQRGHAVTVFNSSLHPFKGTTYHGVEIVHCYDAEDKVGTAGQFLYDYNCIKKCGKRDFDIIYQLGYTSSSIWGKFLPKQSVIITNMDGLEWKRTKYTAPVRKFLETAEKWAIKSSDYCIADNRAIKKYLDSKYQISSVYIPYGVKPVTEPDKNLLTEFGVQPSVYNLAIARLEPENNIETIITGHVNSKSQIPLVVVGALHTDHGEYLKEKYASPKIIFVGAIFDSDKLNALRRFSNIYFHGHSVGGTNPSLLEAMAASALICGHDNEFNREVLGEDGFYFSNATDISALLDKPKNKNESLNMMLSNLNKVTEQFNWDKVTDAYESLFKGALKTHEEGRSS